MSFPETASSPTRSAEVPSQDTPDHSIKRLCHRDPTPLPRECSARISPDRRRHQARSGPWTFDVNSNVP